MAIKVMKADLIRFPYRELIRNLYIYISHTRLYRNKTNYIFYWRIIAVCVHRNNDHCIKSYITFATLLLLSSSTIKYLITIYPLNFNCIYFFVN